MSQQEKLTLITLEDDGAADLPDIADESLLAWREELFALAQDRSKPIELRAAEILQTAGRTLSHHSWAEWAEIYLELERLEPSWTGRLLELKETDLTGISLPDAMVWEPALEQLLVYFLYRQMPLALDDGEYEGRAALAVLSFAMIRRLLLVHFALHGSVVLADLIEIARQYSAEIEYSDENVEILLYRIQEVL